VTAVALLRAAAVQQLTEWEVPVDDRHVSNWIDHMLETNGIADEILAAMPEISRSNDPEISPQQYECGCVAVTRITDRDCREWRNGGEKPFEMRLALPCSSPACELAELRSKERKEKL
jgi:hypothetical protein